VSTSMIPSGACTAKTLRARTPKAKTKTLRARTPQAKTRSDRG
jgi:hypothetical protein